MENNPIVGCLGIFGVGALIIIGGVLIGGFHFSSLGRGDHSGYVTAVDFRGYIFPNYEVFFKTDTSSSQEDSYCVSRSDEKLASQLKEAARLKQRVTIEYHGVRGTGLGICEGAQIDSMARN